MTADVATYRRGVIELYRLLVPLTLCEEPSTDTLCECRGVLAYVAGRWQHVEACTECYDSPRPCRDTHRHIACVDPHPLVCAHSRCREQIDLEVPCAFGLAKRSCCGCCWVTSDALEGRRMWPW